VPPPQRKADGKQVDAKFIDALKQFSAEKMMKVNLFETAHFFCDIYCFEPGQQQKLHSHEDADKIYFVLEGAGRFQIGDEQARLNAGNCVLAAAGRPHGVENDSQARLILLVFMAPNPNIKK
jgi:mannose-6-phosphate isomerase-like protein (cupin superfamily)